MLHISNRETQFWSSIIHFRVPVFTQVSANPVGLYVGHPFEYSRKKGVCKQNVYLLYWIWVAEAGYRVLPKHYTVTITGAYTCCTMCIVLFTRKLFYSLTPKCYVTLSVSQNQAKLNPTMYTETHTRCNSTSIHANYFFLNKPTQQQAYVKTSTL